MSSIAIKEGLKIFVSPAIGGPHHEKDLAEMLGLFWWVSLQFVDIGYLPEA